MYCSFKTGIIMDLKTIETPLSDNLMTDCIIALGQD